MAGAEASPTLGQQPEASREPPEVSRQVPEATASGEKQNY